MADNGIRTTNLPSSPLVEVLGHYDAGGGARSVGRQSIDEFIQRLLALAGSDPSVVAEVSLRLTEEIARAKAAEAAVQTNVDKNAVFIAGKGTRPRAVYARPRLYGFWFPRQYSFQAWGVCYVPDRTIASAASIVTWLHGLGGVPGFADLGPITSLRVDVYEMNANVADTTLPTNAPSALIYSRDYLIRDVAEEPSNSVRVQRVALPTPDLPSLKLGKGYHFILTAFLASGAATAFGIAQSFPTSSTLPRDKGFVRLSDGWYTVSDNPVAFQVDESVGVPDTNRDGPFIERASSTDVIQTFWLSDTVLIPNLLVERGRASLRVKSAPLTFPLPGAVTRTVSVQLQTLAIAFPHEEVRAVSVRRASDNVLLTEGTNYTVNYATGEIAYSTPAAGSTLANVTYTADQTRYDAVYLDPASGTVQRFGGTERGKDVTEFVPAAPLGTILLYNAYVTKNRGVELVPLYTHRDGVRVGAEGEHTAWLQAMRTRLPELFRRLREGLTITLCVVGDSIQAIGGQSQAQWTVPNGPNRDTASDAHLAGGAISADVLAALPRYDHDDGTGATHVHISWVWHLVAAMEAVSTSTIIVQNLAVGGSKADGTAPGGNSVEMRAAYKATGAHLFLCNFGMNQIADSNLYNQCVALFRELRSYGGEVIDMPIALPPQIGQVTELSDWWISNNDKTRAANFVNAEAGGVAYVPAGLICDPDHLGSFGLARRSLCIANRTNHPGPAEHAAYGRILASIVKGA